MNNTIESMQKDIANDFALSDLLSDLIKVNIQSVADEVLIKYPYHKDGIDSIKLGAAEAWINRLCGMLRESELHYLLQLMQQHESKLETR